MFLRTRVARYQSSPVMCRLGDIKKSKDIESIRRRAQTAKEDKEKAKEKKIDKLVAQAYQELALERQERRLRDKQGNDINIPEDMLNHREPRKFFHNRGGRGGRGRGRGRGK